MIQNHAVALMEMRVPFDIVVEKNLWNAPFMSKYKALLVPDASCLSDRDLRALKQYVRAGGRLITTAFTGSSDELGRPRAKSWCRLFFDKCSARNEQSVAVGKGTVVFLPFISPGDDMRLLKGYMFAGSRRFALEDRNRRQEEVKNQIGNPAKLLSVTNCPIGITVNPMRQKHGKKARYILHIMNRTGSGHTKNIGISLALKRGDKPRRVTVLSPDSGREKLIKFTWNKSNEVSFMLPDFRIYSLVVVE